QWLHWTTSSPPRYVYVSGTPPWEGAQSYCRKHHTDLASIRNENEMVLVDNVMPIGDVTFAAVGLSRKTWSYWSDGTEHKFKNWLTEHPFGTTGDCATSLIGDADAGKWFEQPCDQKLPFMCYDSEFYDLTPIRCTQLTSSVSSGVNCTSVPR
uniref:C-type lectin domain-containing protein n=1 Tax=Stegastes partitus TaxID=144197 RepID=A0A3B5A3A4_9TELE